MKDKNINMRIRADLLAALDAKISKDGYDSRTEWINEQIRTYLKEDKTMSKSQPEILILSGEGEYGSFEKYEGAGTNKALKALLTKERKIGRWAKIYIFSHENEGGSVYYNFEDNSDVRHIEHHNLNL